MIRIAFILLATFGICIKPEPVRLLSATSESWTGGVKGSGRGVNYKVRVEVRRSSKVLSFDTLWVGGRAFSVQASRPHPFNAQDGFKRKDVVEVYASLYQAASRDGDLIPLDEPEGQPSGFQGEGLLSYKVRGKRHFLEIEKIAPLPSVEYP